MIPKGLLYAVAALLVIAIAPLPYAYYELLRFIVCGTFGYLAYLTITRQAHLHTAIFSVSAVLFNPLIPIYLGKEVWVVVDAAAAALLMFVGRHYTYTSA
ncbi:DUF6804 family protein [Spiribacter sp. 218]|uniref:DUF6804 family protein n=1 Tax=Spiribacter pallidus TaxID=1987936 RepID=UPI00349F39E6